MVSCTIDQFTDWDANGLHTLRLYGESLMRLAKLQAARRGVIFQFAADGALTVLDPTGRLSDDYAMLLQEAPPRKWR